jgi:tryptophanyl-tRNA synthetase
MTQSNTSILQPNTKSSSTFPATIVSGVKPTGRPHLGNYFGAIRQHLALQRHPKVFFFVANLHAMTILRDRHTLRDYSFGIVLDYLALGLDPEQVALYLQSDVPETTELTWIFATLITVPELQRGVSYKDTLNKGDTPNAGLLTYPVLQAADILVHRGTHVPVGHDQRQHVEVARELARTFNHSYTPVFPEPEALILDEVAVVPGTDGRKMSKSYNNTIGIFDEGELLRKRVMSIVTDATPLEAPKDPKNDNVFALIKLLATDAEREEITAAYRAGGYGYADAKRVLLRLITETFQEARERRKELEQDQTYVMDVLVDGAKRARASAREVMEQVREVTGIVRVMPA